MLTGGPKSDLFADPSGAGPMPDAGRLLGLPRAFHASTDGEWWRLVRFFSLGPDKAGGPGGADEPGEAIRVGFIAQSPMGQGCTAVFEHIEFAAGAPANLRNGS